ncbi:NAD(P)-binding protein [Thozetella sp. PMI_491]|nr:NAD(P)-binding protein [Thozetella sp. PMI_491]
MSTSEKKIILITGANTGIGWETVKALLQSPQAYHVLLGCRSLEKGEAAVEKLKQDVPSTSSTIELVEIDVASDDSINKLFESVKAKHGRIDALVNNAGILLDKSIGPEISLRECWNLTYNVNVAGAEVMTHTFVPLLLQSSDPRLIFLTSGLATIQGVSKSYAPGPVPVPAGWPKQVGYTPDAYRSSKLALNMMMLSWHWKLREDGVKVWAVSPGFLATGLGGDQAALAARGAGDPSTGGKFLSNVLAGERDADVGKIIAGYGVQPF